MPVIAPGGVRIDLGPPGDAVRYVLSTVDPTLTTRLGNALTTVGTEVKALTSTAVLRASLGDGWSMYGACELMASVFAHNRIVLDDAYTSRISHDGATAVAAVLNRDGLVVSSARLARWSGYGIVDQVETIPRFRRHGLATVVMTMLSNWAVSNGVHTGLLSATEHGATLYRRLGWVAHGEIAGAVRSQPGHGCPFGQPLLPPA